MKSLIIILEVYIYMVREAFLKLTFHSARGESFSRVISRDPFRYIEET